MAGHYSCDNVLLQCYDNQAALEDYKCRMKLEEFYMTGAYCLNSPEKDTIKMSKSSEVMNQREPTQGSPTLECNILSLDESPAPQSGTQNTDQNHSASPWFRCGFIVRGLMFWKHHNTPLKYRTPVNDATFGAAMACGTPTLRRW